MQNEATQTLPSEAMVAVDATTAKRGYGSVLTAAVVVGILLASTSTGRLPFLGWAAAYLVLAIEWDVRERRIPNLLNLLGLVAAFSIATVSGGTEGLRIALLGCGLALLLLFPLFALGALGAGDVKALMVLGALFGPANLLPVLWWMVVVGGVMALGLVAIRGELFTLLRRWARTAQALICSGMWVHDAPAAGTASAGGVPFAVAMGLGAAGFQLWGTPWL